MGNENLLIEPKALDWLAELHRCCSLVDNVGAAQNEPESLQSVPILDSQKEAFTKLEQLLRVKADYSYKDFHIKPRLNPLVCGPTGSGKSTIVRILSEKYGLPMLKIGHSSWIPTGARDTTKTIPLISNFCKQATGTPILFIDELDKFEDTGSEWGSAVRSELFSLLDGEITHTEDAFIVGAGTWQYMHDMTSVGFSDVVEKNDINSQRSIPKELLNRFCHNTLSLDYPSGDEIYRKVCQIHKFMKTKKPKKELVIASYNGTNRGVRFVEEYFTEQLLAGL